MRGVISLETLSASIPENPRPKLLFLFCFAPVHFSNFRHFSAL